MCCSSPSHIPYYSSPQTAAQNGYKGKQAQQAKPHIVRLGLLACLLACLQQLLLLLNCKIDSALLSGRSLELQNALDIVCGVLPGQGRTVGLNLEVLAFPGPSNESFA